MRTLVIDTATRACSVALYDDAQVIASFYEVLGRGHAERLLPMIAGLPDRGKADSIVANVGPGSFTGIRVGVAAARALGLAWGVPVSGYGCLTLVGAMARSAYDQPVTTDVVMTGGHGEYFFQSFDAVGEPRSDAVSLAPISVAAISRAELVAGDVGADLSVTFSDREVLDIWPNAAFWHLVAEYPPLAAIPIYGRAPDAKLPKDKAA
jgi:tRNA threonylcarbamoyladenosine biosynthesis protein TsaB